jgi:hypothetical protein
VHYTYGGHQGFLLVEGSGHFFNCRTGLLEAVGEFKDQETGYEHRFWWKPIPNKFVFAASGKESKLEFEDFERVFQHLKRHGYLQLFFPTNLH